MFWPMEDATDVLAYWQDLILKAPHDLNGWFAFLTVPPVPLFPEQYQLKKMCAIVWCYTGPQDQADEAFRPIREFRKPAIDMAGPIPYPVLQSLFDALLPSGMLWYWKNQFFKEFDKAAIDLHLKHGQLLPTPESTMHIYPINGMVSQVGNTQTAWGYRQANFAQTIVGVSPDPVNKYQITQWAKDYADDLSQYSLGAGYVNMMMDEGNNNVKSAYGENYTRLAEIKAKYDPSNFFHINQNILP